MDRVDKDKYNAALYVSFVYTQPHVQHVPGDVADDDQVRRWLVDWFQRVHGEVIRQLPEIDGGVVDPRGASYLEKGNPDVVGRDGDNPYVIFSP